MDVMLRRAFLSGVAALFGMQARRMTARPGSLMGCEPMPPAQLRSLAAHGRARQVLESARAIEDLQYAHPGHIRELGRESARVLGLGRPPVRR